MSAKILPFSKRRVEKFNVSPILYGGLYDIDIPRIEESNQAFQLVLWAHEDGTALSQALIPKGASPEEPGVDAGESLTMAVRQVFEETGSQPAAIVVNSQSLAASVREIAEGLTLSVGETPPTDQLFAFLEKELVEAVSDGSWIAVLDDPSFVEEIFDVGGRFLDAEPWRYLPDEALLVGLFEEDDALDGGPERIAYVMGRGGDEFGLLLFDDLTDWKLYNYIARTAESEEDLEALPRWCSVSFDDPSSFSDFDRKVMTREGWTTGRDREPIIFTHGGGGALTTTTRDDLAALHTLLLGVSVMAESYSGKDRAHSIALPHHMDFVAGTEDDEEPTLDYRICVPPVGLMGTINRASDDSEGCIETLGRAFLESRMFVISPSLWKRDKTVIDELTFRMNELASRDPRLTNYRPTEVFGAELFVRLTLEDTLSAKPNTYASKAHYDDTFRVSGLFLEFLSDDGWLDPRACRAIRSALRDTRRRHKTHGRSEYFE